MEMSVEGAEQLAEVARRLKAAGRTDFRKDMLKEIKGLAKPMVTDAKSAALAITASGAKTSGLRARMAKAVKLQVLTGKIRSGVRVRVDSKAMGDQWMLPKAFNRGTVRHPVFGSATYVNQDTHSEGWFSDVPKRHAAKVRAGILGVLRRTVDKIAG